MGNSTGKDTLGNTLRNVEAARENQWPAQRDAELIAHLRAEVKEQKRREEPTRIPRTFNRILCAVDFSAASTKAVELARRLATENDAALYLIHVCPTIAVPLGGAVPATPPEDK